MKTIYLDHAATTPLDNRVLAAMQPYLAEDFGNSDSRYSLGRRASLAVLSSRDKILSLIGGGGGNLYFTSSGSEANSWALKGVCAANFGKRNRIILSAIEHPSLLRAAEDMAVFGFETELVRPDSSGTVRPESVERALNKGGAAFVGVMRVNNETGVIQPSGEIYRLCRTAGAFFFCDCVQAAGSLPIECGFADGVSLSAHKFYGPKGVGALWLKKGTRIARLISGGQQEGGLRGSTTNVAGVVGMAEALSIACADLEENGDKVRALRDKFLSVLLSGVEDARLVGDEINRLPSNANVAFSGCRGEEIMFALDRQGVCVSTGSACSSGASKPSPVLLSMGLSEEEAASCVRFTFGRENTLAEAGLAAELTAAAVRALRG